MAAWIAACSSSMVLSLGEENVEGATRRPLFVGDVLVDAGAEYSPRKPRIISELLLPLLIFIKFPENE